MKKITPYLFISPWIIGFLFLFLFPMLFSLYMSLFDWGLTDRTFVGLHNFITILTSDQQFTSSILITFKYAFILVPLNILIGLGLALLLNKKVKGSSFFKSAYYIPTIISGVALAFIWGWILSDNGVLNYGLSLLGISGIDWLDNTNYSLFAVILTTMWSNGTIMVIFLGGLQNIDQEVYESCSIDGASSLMTFRKITLPLLSPTILYNLIMAIIAAFQQITVVMNLTGKGPMNSTYLYSLLVYDTAFKMQNFGYAAALSWIMFGIVAILTMIAMYSSRKWAYYEN